MPIAAEAGASANDAIGAAMRLALYRGQVLIRAVQA